MCVCGAWGVGDVQVAVHVLTYSALSTQQLPIFLLPCGNAGRDIKIKNYDRYSEVVHSLRKDRTKTALVEYLFW